MILFGFLVLILSVIFTAQPIAAERSADEVLLALREGGLVIYWRHAHTDRTQRDRRPLNYDDCSAQRNLSTQGREDARLVGEAIRELGVPIGELYSSPYCRCIDTADLAFTDITAIVDPRLSYILGEKPAKRDVNTAFLNQLLAQPVPAGNRVIVSHTANLKESTGFWPDQEGLMVVFEPSAVPELFGELSPADWARLAAAGIEGDL
ncbi:MAG: histidine phosphatase family protein [Oceanospirillaceae bacterium]|nr:histidine phosphatase family protein [Oceanospirillaceae bacterium]